ncbi:MAG TPA: DinB family protein [Nitriliruptoraceae bacterium]|nr:DinB family protein [Nitriliruptoraceae bacterium]
MDTSAHDAPASDPAAAPPLAPEPDTGDWTWVLERRCPDCGFDADRVAATDVAAMVADTTRRWLDVLTRDDVATRPAPTVWSPLEYACHVRDVHRVYRHRLDLMLTQDDPHYPNWDQDRAAIEQRYDLAEPATVAQELGVAGDGMAAELADVSGGQWARTGGRSDGAAFTVDTMARYYLHDLVHHLWDVGARDDGNLRTPRQ